MFDEHYLEDFTKAGLLETTGGELQHLISDAATMQIIRWTGGGFGMAAHNYDGDMLTDEVAQVRSREQKMDGCLRTASALPPHYHRPTTPPPHHPTTPPPHHPRCTARRASSPPT